MIGSSTRFVLQHDMNCSIVIRAYNEEKHIGRLLEGIQHQTAKDVEVILLDSGSSDSTVSIAESFGAKLVYIPPQEFTFGRSLNFGIQAARSECIVIASAHVYPVYPDWLASLLYPFEGHRVAWTTMNILSDLSQAARERVLCKPLLPYSGSALCNFTARAWDTASQACSLPDYGRRFTTPANENRKMT
jgi:glycosyltransferase involved in cell wall biosynthesis